MFISKIHLPRRTVLKALGATVGLPLLDAMIPAATALAQTAAAPKPSMTFVYFPHGAVMDKWTPTKEGADFELPPILAPLAPFQKQLIVVSGLENKSAVATPVHAAADQSRPVWWHHHRPDCRTEDRAGDTAAFDRSGDGGAGWRRLV
jgi:hypothetical protein